MNQPLKIDADPVLAAQQAFNNSLHDFITTATQMASAVEGIGHAWGGDAQQAAYVTGIDIHSDLKQVHAWGLRLVESVGANVTTVADQDAQYAQILNSLGGESAIST